MNKQIEELEDGLCGDCKEKEFRYYYSFPHPERWYWYCNKLKKELTTHSGVRKDVMCPKLPGHLNSVIPIAEALGEKE